MDFDEFLKSCPLGENISSVRTLLRAALEKQQEGAYDQNERRIYGYIVYLINVIHSAIQDRDNLREQIELAEDFRHHLQQQIEVIYLQVW